MNVPEMRYLSFMSAAREISRHPHQNDEAICAKYGIPLDSLTDDEVKMLESMIQDYMY